MSEGVAGCDYEKGGVGRLDADPDIAGIGVSSSPKFSFHGLVFCLLFRDAFVLFYPSLIFYLLLELLFRHVD